MATSATAKNWRVAASSLNPANIWGELALPGAAARHRIHEADGTPDTTANASAFHYGFTKSGVDLMVAPTFDKFYADEFRGPIITSVGECQMGIAGEFGAITDLVAMTKLLPGIATYATGALSGDDAAYTEMRIGSKAITYSSIAAIFELRETSGEWGLFHLYSALNDAGVKWKQSRKEQGFTAFNFLAFELTTRAATDTLGNIWKTVQTS